jgi:hypothetical protein
LWGDNHAALVLVKDSLLHASTKRIDVHHHVRERVPGKEIVLECCPTEQMIAEALTKGLFRPGHSNVVKEALGWLQ